MTLFDPERIADRATYTQPFQYSEGIEYVIVNGKLVLDNGKHTGARPGRATAAWNVKNGTLSPSALTATIG